MAASSPRKPGLGSQDISYSFEMEFLVAKEREEYSYSDEDDVGSSSSDDNSLCQYRWACPADVEDPYREILDQCRSVLSKNNEPVMVDEDEDKGDAGAGASTWASAAEKSSWLLRPSSHAVERDGCPEEYEWFGVRLRSPLLAESELDDSDSTVKWCIGALRMALRLHVNSTCRFTVFVQPSSGYVGLTDAKKLATVVWLVEREMLLRLGPTPCPSRPVTTHAAVAALPLAGVDSSRPEDPLLAAVMDEYLPRLHDAAAQERLQRLWACQGLGELAEALRGTDGQPLAFSLDVYPDRDAAAGPDAAFKCMACFRYGLWHPYDHLDASNLWIRLALSFCRVMQTEQRRFRKSNQATDAIIRGFAEKGVAESDRWQVLLERLGLTEDWYGPWVRIVAEYGPGGRLSPGAIDRQPPLGQIPELSIYRSR